VHDNAVKIFVASFTFLRKFRNKPYDIFGTWFDETHLLSGDLHWLGNLESYSSLWLWQVRHSSLECACNQFSSCPLPSSKCHLGCDDCLEGKSEDYQNCSVLYRVPHLYTVMEISSSYRCSRAC